MAGLPGALRYGLPTPRSRRFRLPVGGLRRVVHPTILASGDHAHADRGMNHGALYGKGLRALSIATLATIAAAVALIFFYAPIEKDQGIIQKIFYVHVPMAIVALGGFIAGGVFAIKHLRTEERIWDVRSYVAIHLSIVFALGTLI